MLKFAPLLIFLGLWEIAVQIFAVPRYILPAPSSVGLALYHYYDIFLPNMALTALEICLGFGCGIVLGVGFGFLLSLNQRIETAFTPFLLIMQALPVFAIAPLLVIWFGFGLASKLIMAALIIFFPVCATFLQGLKQGEKDYALLATHYKMPRFMQFKLLYLPASLPSLATGLKIGAALAPIAAIVGEWVGSAGGLGFLMLHANARMQTDQMFASLFLLLVMVLVFHYAISLVLKRISL